MDQQRDPARPYLWSTAEGTARPLGMTWLPDAGAYNVALRAGAADAVTLLVYAADEPTTPALTVDLDPARHRSWDTWHCRLDGATLAGLDAAHYAYSVTSSQPGADPDKVLLDPWSVDVFFPPGFSRAAACRPGSNAGRAPLGVIPPRTSTPFDWSLDGKQDRGPRHESDLVVYEAHVRGFTMTDPSVPEPHRGTYLGVADKIDYLRDLGVTAVELLPIFQFDPDEVDYWGYSPLSLFAPHASYAAEPGQQVREFREMVRALHAADIEVILDVVYNHTTEGDYRGPTYSWRGIDNAAYYDLADDGVHYWDASGTGNSLRASDPVVVELVLASLRHWVTEMHVDGFRFDLATVLTRGHDGVLDPEQPLINAMGADPVLQTVRLIAEPWDAGGGATAYQLGPAFPGQQWGQWNGRFRDGVRRFVTGEPGQVGELMSRLYGSEDLFPDDPSASRRAFQSVNFVTCHDGFTLYDLVSYDAKHNQANGEDGHDGTDDNDSWNCGVEGDPAPPDVLALRARQARNLVALLLLANGTPMLRAGDELLQTQGGNNNPYNQDNPTSWLDWSRLDEHADVRRFVQRLLAFRAAHPSLAPGRFWRSRVTWYGVTGGVDLGADSHTLAFLLDGSALDDDDLYVMVNAYWEPLTFTVQEPSRQPSQEPSEQPSREPSEQPSRDGAGWRCAVDTSVASPGDIPDAPTPLAGTSYAVQPRSVVVLVRAASTPQ